jgi:hypothetical protein
MNEDYCRSAAPPSIHPSIHPSPPNGGEMVQILRMHNMDKCSHPAPSPSISAGQRCPSTPRHCSSGWKTPPCNACSRGSVRDKNQSNKYVGLDHQSNKIKRSLLQYSRIHPFFVASFWPASSVQMRSSDWNGERCQIPMRECAHLVHAGGSPVSQSRSRFRPANSDLGNVQRIFTTGAIIMLGLSSTVTKQKPMIRGCGYH